MSTSTPIRPVGAFIGALADEFTTVRMEPTELEPVTLARKAAEWAALTTICALRPEGKCIRNA